MGKGDKQSQFPYRESFLRINYMYQAAHLVLRNNPNNTELVRFYMQNLRSIAKRQVLKLHPDIKRTLCKKCSMLLVPGITATVRHKGKRQPHLIVRCLECETVKKFMTQDKSYKLWIENPLAWVAMSTDAKCSTGQKSHSRENQESL